MGTCVSQTILLPISLYRKLVKKYYLLKKVIRFTLNVCITFLHVSFIRIKPTLKFKQNEEKKFLQNTKQLFLHNPLAHTKPTLMNTVVEHQ